MSEVMAKTLTKINNWEKFFSGIIVNGLTVVNLPTIEKEFGISSKAVGSIVAGNDASALLFVGAISFFGTKGHKPKWTGIGVLITGTTCTFI